MLAVSRERALSSSDVTPSTSSLHQSASTIASMIKECHGASEVSQENRKRHAGAGQWLTPPQMLFPQVKQQLDKGETAGDKNKSQSHGERKRSVSMGNVPSLIEGFTRTDVEKPHRNSKRSRKNSSKDVPSMESLKSGLQRSNSKMSKLMVMSCPNLMAVIYDRLEREDQRRNRRLARNRASARLRRLRKKTILDQLIIEVEDLERQMITMRGMARKIGPNMSIPTTTNDIGDVAKGQDDEEKDDKFQIGTFINDLHPLLNAFVASTTKYITSPCQRRQNARFAVDESIAEVEMLMCDLALPLVATQSACLAEEDVASTTTTKASDLVAVARKRLERNCFTEILRLSDEQMTKIRALEASIQNEMVTLQAIKKCYTCTQHRNWHVLDTADEWNYSYTGLLSHEQTQRFLKWIKTNKDTIAKAVPVLSTSSRNGVDGRGR